MNPRANVQCFARSALECAAASQRFIHASGLIVFGERVRSVACIKRREDAPHSEALRAEEGAATP